MKPTEELSQEHKVILSVLDVAEKEAAKLQKSGRARAWTIEKLLDFFQSYCDKCHQVKEERQLFVKMEERGVTRVNSPLGQMLTEHGEARRHVAAIASTLPLIREGNRDAVRNAANHLAAYSRLLRQHIRKEDLELFPMAARVFTLEDLTELSAGFAKIERDVAGKGVHKKYQALAQELTANSD